MAVMGALSGAGLWIEGFRAPVPALSFPLYQPRTQGSSCFQVGTLWPRDGE